MGNRIETEDHADRENAEPRGNVRESWWKPFLRLCRASAGAVVFWCVAVMLAVTAYYGLGDLLLPVAGQLTGGNLPKGSAKTDAGMPEEGGPQGSGGDAGGSAPAQLREDAAGGTAEVPAVKERKTVALTFDDGPHPVYTKMLLDGLKERGVSATFFVVGQNIPGNEDLIARMEKEGHLIGNHTYDHVKICDMKKEDACSQVEKTSALVREITGHDTEFVRPPFGTWDPNLECSFVMIPVLWDVDPLDWTTSDASLVVQRVLSEVEDQDIILLHDFYRSSVEAALQIADLLKEDGYDFVTVDKLILN